MSYDSAFTDLMPSTIVVQSFASVSTDGYLTPVYSTGTSWSCRVVQQPERIVDQDGVEVSAKTTVWVASTSTFDPYSKLTVDGSTLGPVLAVWHYDDEDGHHHSKVAFG